MDQRLTEFSLEWLTIAADDLKWAKDTYADGHFARTCFVCQQVAEKSLKGFLYGHKVEEKTHNLIRLLLLAAKIDSGFSTLKDTLSILDPYYISTRYPDIGDIKQFDTEDLAKEALVAAEEVFIFVKKKITK